MEENNDFFGNQLKTGDYVLYGVGFEKGSCFKGRIKCQFAVGKILKVKSKFQNQIIVEVRNPEFKKSLHPKDIRKKLQFLDSNMLIKMNELDLSKLKVRQGE